MTRIGVCILGTWYYILPTLQKVRPRNFIKEGDEYRKDKDTDYTN